MRTFIAALLLAVCSTSYAAGTITIVDPNQVNGMAVNSDGSINTKGAGGSGGSSSGATSANTSIAMTGSSVTLLAAAPTRVEAIITNTTGVSCNIGLGSAAASTTGPLLAPGAIYIENQFTGLITANCASGNMAVTQVTP